jgi:uncharacterized membrane protein (UPF0127 family)
MPVDMTEPVPEAAADPAMAAPGAGSGRFVARNRTRGTLLASDIESADSLWAKFMGLMGRRDLAPGSGLWLPESNGIHMMFMRFPIDAVFLGRLDAHGTRPVLAARPDLPAWRGLVPLVRGAKGVLELPAGTIEATSTMVGDSVSLER